tara:strand:+ start:526 stop:651 length:126 start_codon:yes stop_codon:yes gene_type:complete
MEVEVEVAALAQSYVARVGDVERVAYRKGLMGGCQVILILL